MPRLLRPETITLPLVLCCAGLSAQEDRKRPGVRKEILELVRKGRVERAITRLDDWLHANPKDLSLHRVRLDLLEGKEAWHAAAIRGRRLLALLSDDLEKQALLVRLARFETKAKRPQSFASRLELVRVHRDRGEPAQCLSL